MVFSSLLFLFRFLPAVLAAYYLLPKKCRNLVLFAFSLIFYAWGEPVYVVLILFSAAVDYTAGRAAAYCREKGCSGRARLCVAASVVVNLGLLGFFKYGGFFLGNIRQLTGLAVPSLNLALPIGISFYTFQTMSYTIDVYRGDAPVQKNFITFGAYVSLFPQLIAGPVVRYGTVAEQLSGRRESVGLFAQGILRFSVGLGKKVILANSVGMLWDEIAACGASELTTSAAWLGVLAFTLQIYFDFSGYSDMAVGLGKMFGFTFPENFQYPYESKTVTEFWRRWHMSLGTWFREYVYIPLGGNRRGTKRQILNIFVVWFLTGLWHGAGWNFVLWGLYYGVLLVLEKVFWKYIQKIPGILAHMGTMLAVMFGWCIFSWPDMADVSSYMKALFFCGGAGAADGYAVYLVWSNLILLIVCIFGSLSAGKRIVEKILKTDAGRDVAALLFSALILTACTAMLVQSSYNPFLYFRF